MLRVRLLLLLLVVRRRAPRNGRAGRCEDGPDAAAVPRARLRQPDAEPVPLPRRQGRGRPARARGWAEDEPAPGPRGDAARCRGERAAGRRADRTAADHRSGRDRLSLGLLLHRRRASAEGAAAGERPPLSDRRARPRLPRAARLPHHADPRTRVDRRHRADRAGTGARHARLGAERGPGRDAGEPQPPDPCEQPAEVRGAVRRRRLRALLPAAAVARCGHCDSGRAADEPRARRRAGHERGGDHGGALARDLPRRTLARPALP